MRTAQVFFVTFLLSMVYGCGGGGGGGDGGNDSSGFDHLTAAGFKSTASEKLDADENVDSAYLAHEDGFGNSAGEGVDIGNVVLSTVLVEDFDGTWPEVAFAYDLRLADGATLPDSEVVLYLDTDETEASGKKINGIGADYRLSSKTDHSFSQWDDATNSWTELATGGHCCGQTVGYKEVTDDGEVIGNKLFVLVHGTHVFYPTDSSSGDFPAQAVVALEQFTADGKNTEKRFDASKPFTVDASEMH